MLIAGLVLICLGLGNHLMGLDKTQRYERRMRAAIARSGAEVTAPLRTTASLLEEYSTDRELYADSYDKHEYYRVLHRGGLLLMVIGCVLIAGAVARKIYAPSGPDDQEPLDKLWAPGA